MKYTNNYKYHNYFYNTGADAFNKYDGCIMVPQYGCLICYPR